VAVKRLILISCLFFPVIAFAQLKLRGTVYDSSRTYPLEAVSVMSTAGTGTVTSGSGSYEITVNEKDSVWFSYLGKPTIKFPVKKITDLGHFDISLKVPVKPLKEIVIKPRNYKQDSIQNRIDYAKAFNFRRPNLESMTSIGPMGAGIDIDELIRVFQFRKNRSMDRFRQRLIQEEQDKFIDHKFTKLLVRRLTGFGNEDLEKFMKVFRPTYEFTLLSSDYDFQAYIKEAARLYREGVKPFND
jgi:hypothetical protein